MNDKQNDVNKKQDGMKHGQSAELVEEIKERAGKEHASRRNPNEMGQQPLGDQAKKPHTPTPQELRERPRE